jgi:acyl carrier protein
LHDLTRSLRLEFFVLFSSAASIWGGRDQGHYAAANQFLDAVAHERRACGLPATSINWGLWAEGGMSTPEADEQFQSVGLRPMPTDMALLAIDRLIQASGAQRTVAWVDWSLFKPVYEARGARRLLEAIPSGSPRRALAGAPELRKRLDEAPPAEARKLLLDLVTAHVTRVLGFASGESPAPDRGFFDLGMDSLMAMQLMRGLGELLGQVLPTVLAFEQPNIASLAAHLAELFIAGKEGKGEAPAGEAAEEAEEEDELSEEELAALLAEKLARPIRQTRDQGAV